MDRRGAQHAPVVRPPSTYGRAGPGAAVVEVEGFVLPGVLVCSARCHAPPRSLPRGPWPPLFAHVQINVPAPPHVLMLRTQAVGVKSCRPRSGLLTWHPSASTADSLLILPHCTLGEVGGHCELRGREGAGIYVPVSAPISTQCVLGGVGSDVRFCI